MRIIVCYSGAVILIFVFGSICLAEGASFRGLDFLQAWGVSGDGNTVVGLSYYHRNGNEAVIWTEANGTVVLAHLPEGDRSFSDARGVSYDGSFIVGYDFVDFDGVLCRWSGPDNIQRLSEEEGYALAISADGLTVVGSYLYNGFWKGFRWTEANGMQGLCCLPRAQRYDGEAWGVSADGRVVVGWSSNAANRQEAFRWTESTGMVGLGNLRGGEFESCAYDVSADGLVVVGSTWNTQTSEAFIWTESEGMRGLGYLPGGSYSWAEAVSGDGTVVVGKAYGPNDGYEAFIWDANHGMQNLKDVLKNAYGLNLTGWQLFCGGRVDISADGRTIVGTSQEPNGNRQAWMVVLGPPPPPVKLTVQIEPNDADINTVTPAIGEHIYYQSWPVILKAPDSPKCPVVYRFSHWQGDVADPNSPTTTIVMTEEKTVTAVYVADERRCGDECHPILQGDLNRDCYINFEDFAIYCTQWLACTHPDCD